MRIGSSRGAWFGNNARSERASSAWESEPFVSEDVQVWPFLKKTTGLSVAESPCSNGLFALTGNLCYQQTLRQFS